MFTVILRAAVFFLLLKRNSFYIRQFQPT